MACMDDVYITSRQAKRGLKQMTKRIVALDSQKLDAIQACMYMYKLRFGGEITQGITPLVTPDYFERGGLLHIMLEPYYKLKAHKSRWQQNRATHRTIVQNCINIGRYKATKMQIDIAEVENVIDTFLKYTDFWENDGWDNIKAVEQVGSKIIYDSEDLTILYEFKIDLILQLQNAIIPVDHKSAKARRDPNQLANQFKGYCVVLGVNNIMINEIGFQKSLKPQDKFRRHVLSYSNEILEEWVGTTVWWVRHAMDVIESGYYPQNFTSCDKYSGCIYKEICIADQSVRDYKINSMFNTKNRWDVGAQNL